MAIKSSNKPADLFARGAGLVNPAGAMDPGLVYNIHPSNYISYICGVEDIDRPVSVVLFEVQFTATRPLIQNNKTILLYRSP